MIQNFYVVHVSLLGVYFDKCSILFFILIETVEFYTLLYYKGFLSLLGPRHKV